MKTLLYLALLLSGLILITSGHHVYKKARLSRNKRIGRAMVFAGSIAVASILFFFTLVSAFGGG